MSHNQDIIKQLIQQDTTLTGTVNPTLVTPVFIGQIYINTGANTIWVAKSVSVGDWIEAGSGSSGTIDVQKDDASVNANTSALNFEGSGVDSVVDDGGGKTTVNISSGGGGVLTGIVGGDKYVDRGNPLAVDFDEGDLTDDSTWRELDLSSVLPPEAANKLVHIHMVADNTNLNVGFFLKETAHVGSSFSFVGITTHSTGANHADLWVQCDSDRKILYLLSSSGSWDSATLTVRGWDKTELVDTELIGEDYINRGDPSAYDWASGDFTKDNAWYELDASSILPPEAAGELIHIRMSMASSSISDYIQIREKGNASVYNAAYMRGVSGAGDYWIRCDADRKFEYRVNQAGTISSLAVVIRGWNIPKVGGSRNPIVGGDQIIDRGAMTACDYDNNLTKDATWRTLDLSHILPSEAAGKMAMIRLKCKGAPFFKFYIRPVGYPGYNAGSVTALSTGNFNDEDVWVAVTKDRKIEYYLDTQITDYQLAVRAWTVEATVDHLVRGDEYVDRGDPAAWDFTAGDFTKDNAWYDFDLSNVLPVEAAGQLVHLRINLRISNTVGANAYFKTNGNTNNVNGVRCTCQVLNIPFTYDVWIRCDVDRKMKYRIQSGVTWNDINIGVRGWMKTSDGGAVAGTKYVSRGDLTAWDFSDSDFTRDSAWHVLDLSSVLPESAKNQLVHFRLQGRDNSTSSRAYFAHPDENSGWNIAAMYTRVVNLSQSQDIHVKCNNNRQIAYRIDSGYDSISLLVRGWFEPIDKGQAIQPTYGAPVVHMDWKDANIITVKAGRYFVDGGWYELESDLDWTWAASGQNFGVDTGTGEANGWWYLYMFLYGDKPAVVASQTAPTAAYDTDLSGTAYDKNIYLGAYYNDAGSIREFYQSGRDFYYAAAQGLVSTTSISWQAKTIAVPVTADQVIGIINLHNIGSGTPGNAFYSPNANQWYVGVRNNENTTIGHVDQFVAPIVIPQTGYIRTENGVATNTANMWTLGWRDRFLQ